MLWLVLAALLLSLADALFLLVVAGYIGALETVGLVVVTALLGVLLVRHQGRATIHRIQRRLQRGEAPTDELIDGAMILFGAGLLITPGLLTDLTGFLFVVPVTRYPLRVALRRWVVGPYIRRKIESGAITVDVSGSIGGWPAGGADGWSSTDDEPDAPEGDRVDLDADAYDVVDEEERT